MRPFDRVLGLRATTDGGVAFFPWGLLGPGYVLPTDELVSKVRFLVLTIAAFFSACAVWCGQLVRMNMRVLSQVRAARGPGYRAS